MDIHINHSSPSIIIQQLYSFIHHNDIPIDIEYIEKKENYSSDLIQDTNIPSDSNSDNLKVISHNNTIIYKTHIPGPYRYLKNVLDTVLFQENKDNLIRKSNQTIFSYLFSNTNTNLDNLDKDLDKKPEKKPEKQKIEDDISRDPEKITDIHLFHIENVNNDIISSLKYTKLYYLYSRQNKKTLWI
jgi:hypothetical protein